MARRSLIAAITLVVALSLAASASASRASDVRAIEKGLRAAVKADKLTRAEATAHRAELTRTRRALRRFSWTPAANLGAVLHDTAAQARRLKRPRALVLFSELRLNRRWLRAHPMPGTGVDVFDPHGVLYRSFPGQGLRFHPLGNFARLNGLLGRGRLEEARRLADALSARAITRARGTKVWEYMFPFGWGAAPWTSGMAQASAAQTLAWGAAVLGDAGLRLLARRAFRAIPGRLTMRLAAGPWVHLYSFSTLRVLNAQLQTALSIGDYARRTGDARARRLARRLRASSARLLPSFDTGYWSLYSPGNESPLRYHVYVIQLLRKLWERTDRPLWRNRAAAFERYTNEPPILRPGWYLKRIYPRPVDGFRDSSTVSFWLSKESSVTLRLPGLAARMHLGHGWHRVTWRPTGVAPGRYRPRLTALDLAGNRARVKFAPITITVDRDPPKSAARLRGRRLSWRVVDRETPWIRLTLRLDRGNHRRWIPLGIHSHHGSTRLSHRFKRSNLTLVVSDSTGNRSRVHLRAPVGP